MANRVNRLCFLFALSCIELNCSGCFANACSYCSDYFRMCAVVVQTGVCFFRGHMGFVTNHVWLLSQVCQSRVVFRSEMVLAHARTGLYQMIWVVIWQLFLINDTLHFIAQPLLIKTQQTPVFLNLNYVRSIWRMRSRRIPAETGRKPIADRITTGDNYTGYKR